MKIEKVYLIQTHRISFRPGEPAVILGVEMCTPDGGNKEPRLCYHIEYPDYAEDFVAIEDNAGAYEILTIEKIKLWKSTL
jgi:hypothetical protein